jgi:hypothetical protein
VLAGLASYAFVGTYGSQQLSYDLKRPTEMFLVAVAGPPITWLAVLDAALLVLASRASRLSMALVALGAIVAAALLVAGGISALATLLVVGFRRTKASTVLALPGLLATPLGGLVALVGWLGEALRRARARAAAG